MSDKFERMELEATAAAAAASDEAIAQRTIAAAAFVPLKDTFMNRNAAASSAAPSSRVIAKRALKSSKMPERGLRTPRARIVINYGRKRRRGARQVAIARERIIMRDESPPIVKAELNEKCFCKN